MWLHSLEVAQLLRSAACLHTNQSRSYLNHLVDALRLTTVAVEAPQCILYVMDDLHVTANYTKILNVAQQRFYGEFMSRQQSNVPRSSCKVPETALKHKNVHLFMAFFRLKIWLNRS